MTPPLSPVRAASVRDLYAKATPRPWRVSRFNNQIGPDDCEPCAQVIGAPGAEVGWLCELYTRGLGSEDEQGTNADLIVALVNEGESLLARVEALERVLVEARDYAASERAAFSSWAPGCDCPPCALVRKINEVLDAPARTKGANTGGSTDAR